METEKSPFPSSTSNDWELISEPSSDPVAYLRDAKIMFLYPIYGNCRLLEGEPQQEGSTFEFLFKLDADLIEQGRRMTAELKDEIYLIEIRRHLLNKRKDDLAKSIKSLEDRDKIPRQFLRTFRDEKEKWYFNNFVSHGSTDEYQLLCLGDQMQNLWHEAIPGINDLNNVGNSLKADLQYKEFSDMVFKELQWDDTEEQGVKKALAIRDTYFPDMKDRVIPWLLVEIFGTYIHIGKGSICTGSYGFRLRRNGFDYQHSFFTVNFYSSMTASSSNHSDVVSDLIGATYGKCICTEFARIKMYIEKRRRNGSKMRVQGLIISYFESIMGGEPKRAGGVYLFYVKEKIRMALQLGIIQKEDVMESDVGSELLKDIEQYNPCYFVDYYPS